MKEIKAIIRPVKLIDVVAELRNIKGLPGVTISEIREFGKSHPKDDEQKNVDGLVTYVEKIKIEVIVPDEMVETVINAIQVNAHTGNTGDGKIFVYSVEDIVKIRTNERGLEAL